MSDVNVGDGTVPMAGLTPIAFTQALGTATFVAVGWKHTCVLFSTGKVACFGSNSGGELGIGSTENVGCASCKTVISLEGIVFPDATLLVKSISVGAFHSCAVFTTGKMMWYEISNFDQDANGENINICGYELEIAKERD